MFISICGCGEACGFGEADGICMPGIFICWGEAVGVGDCLVPGIFIPGMVIPGMFCIRGFIVERARDRLRRCLMRCVLDIFIPGIFIPGILAMLCFFTAGFFLDAIRFFCELLLPIFIPDMFFISCGTAEEPKPLTKVAARITATREILLNSMLPPVINKHFRAQSFSPKHNCANLCLHTNHRLI